MDLVASKGGPGWHSRENSDNLSCKEKENDNCAMAMQQLMRKYWHVLPDNNNRYYWSKEQVRMANGLPSTDKSTIHFLI